MSNTIILGFIKLLNLVKLLNTYYFFRFYITGFDLTATGSGGNLPFHLPMVKKGKLAK